MAARRSAGAPEIQEAQDTVELVYEISRILNTGLDRETLSILIALCECGVNPEALAMVVKEMRREAAALQANEEEEKDKAATATGPASTPGPAVAAAAGAVKRS